MKYYKLEEKYALSRTALYQVNYADVYTKGGN